MPKPKACAIYCRISRDVEREGLGVKRQEADCRDLAEREGWTVAEVYVDNDTSAYSGKARPGYTRMMEGVANGRFRAIVAWHPDRLHRRPVELEDFIAAIESAKVAVATVTAGGYDLSTPSGRLIARNLGAAARYESEHKSERLRRKHQQLAEDGRLSGGGRRPFGYEADRLTIREQEAAEIRHAADNVLAGDSLRSVVVDWKARGVATVTGASWSPTTVRRLLRSGRIAGLREHRGQVIGPAVWPAVITKRQHERLRRILDDPERDRVAGVTARSYLLSGFVFCARCEAKMSTRPTARQKCRYVCSTDRGGCGRCGISAPDLEQLVTAELFDWFADVDMARVVAAREQAADTVDTADELEARLAQLAQDHYVDGLIGRGEFLAAREPLQADLDRAKAATATVSILGDLDGTEVADRWGSLSFDRKRQILGAVLHRVWIAPTTRANNRFDADRVAVDWRD